MKEYTFDDICETITSMDANNICCPTKEKDWLCVAKHIMAGFSIITGTDEWVKHPADGLVLFDKTFDNFKDTYAHASLNALYYFITGELANTYLLDDGNDEDGETVKGCVSRQSAKRRTLMNRAYVHFAKAATKAYICDIRDDKKSVSEFLKELHLETFGQFRAKRTAFDDFTQIED